MDFDHSASLAPFQLPDLNPWNFYVKDHLKSVVYGKTVNKLNDFRSRKIQGFDDIRGDRGVFQWVRDLMVNKARAWDC